MTDSESYVHRLGRSGRAGKAGSGLLLLADHEAPGVLRVLRDVGGAPLQPAGPASAITGGLSGAGAAAPSLALQAVLAKMGGRERDGSLAQVRAGREGGVQGRGACCSGERDPSPTPSPTSSHAPPCSCGTRPMRRGWVFTP